MTPAEMRAERAALERDVAQAVEASVVRFVERTGLTIKDVRVELHPYRVVGEDFDRATVGRVTAEVRL